MTDEEKERYKVRYGDLAPSLQEMFNTFITQSQYDEGKIKLEDLKGLIGDLVITIGYTKPTKYSALKNVYFNSVNILPSAVNDTGSWQNAVMLLGTNYVVGGNKTPEPI